MISTTTHGCGRSLGTWTRYRTHSTASHSILRVSRARTADLVGRARSLTAATSRGLRHHTAGTGLWTTRTEGTTRTPRSTGSTEGRPIGCRQVSGRTESGWHNRHGLCAGSSGRCSSCCCDGSIIRRSVPVDRELAARRCRGRQLSSSLRDALAYADDASRRTGKKPTVVAVATRTPVRDTAVPAAKSSTSRHSCELGFPTPGSKTGPLTTAPRLPRLRGSGPRPPGTERLEQFGCDRLGQHHRRDLLWWVLAGTHRESRRWRPPPCRLTELHNPATPRDLHQALAVARSAEEWDGPLWPITTNDRRASGPRVQRSPFLQAAIPSSPTSRNLADRETPRCSYVSGDVEPSR